MSKEEDSGKFVEEYREDDSLEFTNVLDRIYKLEADIRESKRNFTLALKEVEKGLSGDIEVAEGKLQEAKLQGMRYIQEREERLEKKLEKKLEKRLMREIQALGAKHAKEIEALNATVERLKGQAPINEAGGGGQNGSGSCWKCVCPRSNSNPGSSHGDTNITSPQTRSDIEGSTTNDPKYLLDKVWDQMKDAENHFLIGLFFLGALIMSGLMRYVIPCGRTAVFLFVGLPVFLVLLAATSMLKIYCLGQADKRRVIYIRQLYVPLLLHSFVIGLAVASYVIAFAVSYVQRNCRKGKLVQNFQPPP